MRRSCPTRLSRGSVFAEHWQGPKIAAARNPISAFPLCEGARRDPIIEAVLLPPRIREGWEGGSSSQRWSCFCSARRRKSAPVGPRTGEDWEPGFAPQRCSGNHNHDYAHLPAPNLGRHGLGSDSPVQLGMMVSERTSGNQWEEET